MASADVEMADAADAAPVRSSHVETFRRSLSIVRWPHPTVSFLSILSVYHLGRQDGRRRCSLRNKEMERSLLLAMGYQYRYGT